jgi:hypothetical protein
MEKPFEFYAFFVVALREPLTAENAKAAERKTLRSPA